MYVCMLFLQTLRVQSPEGTKRIQVNTADTVSSLFEKVYILQNTLFFF